MSFFQAQIVLPLFPLVTIAICALLAAASELALHYYFHPGLRRELGRLACYVYGSLAWVIPLLFVFAALGDYGYIPATLALLGAAGAATWWANHRDQDEETRGRAEDGEKLLAEAEKQCGDCHVPHD